jgi:hypothetical protein
LDAFDEPTFFELPPPTLADLNTLALRVATRIVDLLRKRGIWRNRPLAGMGRHDLVFFKTEDPASGDSAIAMCRRKVSRPGSMAEPQKI